MSKVNKTGYVNGRLRPLGGEREGFRVLSSARDLYVYKNCAFLTLARAQ